MTLKYSLKCKKVKKKGAVDKSVCLALWFMAEPTQEESRYKKKVWKSALNYSHSEPALAITAMCKGTLNYFDLKTLRLYEAVHKNITLSMFE